MTESQVGDRGNDVINGNAQPIPGWDGGDGNSAYLDKTLRYAPVETVLDDRVAGRVVAALWFRAWAVSTICFLLLFLVGIILALLTGNSLGSSYGGTALGALQTNDGGLGAPLMIAAPIVSGVLFWVLLLVSKLNEPIGEWRVLLHDRDDAESTYSRIREVVLRRRFELAAADRWTVEPGRERSVRMRLVLSQGDCQATISVFRYGTSLYLGWQMWRTRSGTRLLLRYLTDLAGSLKGRAGLQWAMLRTESTRAMREAVHAACREGLLVAIEREQVPLSAGFPDGNIPMVTYAGSEGASAAPYAGAPAAPAAPYAAAPGAPSAPLSSGVPPQYAGQAPPPPPATAPAVPPAPAGPPVAKPWPEPEQQ
ncbi:hypothetical protein [Kitasatospora sp. GP82]|uniref:hypothetical protein n=1 Tax=Kitasatospora sp. GP82 TaxID=3035089 RepID=UPI002475B99D|nr:hypothetical protein [Kitasatospora sp. GP82]